MLSAQSISLETPKRHVHFGWPAFWVLSFELDSIHFLEFIPRQKWLMGTRRDNDIDGCLIIVNWVCDHDKNPISKFDWLLQKAPNREQLFVWFRVRFVLLLVMKMKVMHLFVFDVHQFNRIKCTIKEKLEHVLNCFFLTNTINKPVAIFNVEQCVENVAPPNYTLATLSWSI